MADVKFYYLTKAQYDGQDAKDANGIYFLSDAKTLHRGGEQFAKDVEVVTALPETGVAQTGVLYINSTNKTASYFNGTAFQTLVPELATTISGAGDSTHIPTTGAVTTYVDEKVDEIQGSVGTAVTAVTYDATGKQLSVKNAGIAEAVVTKLSGLVDGASYNGGTGVLTLTTNGGTPVTINLPQEDFLADATRKEVEEADLTGTDAAVYEGCQAGDIGILLTMTQGAKLFVKLTDLVDTYTATDTATVDMTVAGYAISASVKVSATAGNLLTAEADGLYVAPTKVAAGTANSLVIAAADGALSNSGKTTGGATLNATPNANTLATEAAVKAAADGKLNVLGAAANGQIIVGGANASTVAGSGKTIGGATLNATPNANTVATEAAVSAAIDGALSWITTV